TPGDWTPNIASPAGAGWKRSTAADCPSAGTVTSTPAAPRSAPTLHIPCARDRDMDREGELGTRVQVKDAAPPTRPLERLFPLLTPDLDQPEGPLVGRRSAGLGRVERLGFEREARVVERRAGRGRFEDEPLAESARLHRSRAVVAVGV